MNASVWSAPVRWERTLFSFFRGELAPSTARWHATLRVTLACAFCVALINALHIPQGEFMMVTLFIVSQTDAWASVNRAVLRVVGTLAGGALGIVVILSCADKPWILYPLQALVIFASLFFTRTTTAPYAFLIFGITYLVVVPEYPSNPAFNIETGLWRIAETALGAVIGTAAQILLWRNHPEPMLLDDIAVRLATVEKWLGSLSSAVTFRKSDARVDDPVLATGMARQLDLLKEAEAMSRWLRQRHTEQIKLIVDVQRLVSACARLREERADTVSLPPWARARLDEIRAECIRLRQSIETRRVPPPWKRSAGESFPIATTSSGDVELLAAIYEMETSLTDMPRVLAFLESAPEGEELAGERLPRQPVAEQTLFGPQCTLANYEAIHSALKGGLSASICGLLYDAFNWPGISTCVLTCLVVAQSTVGAGRRKAILRFLGVSLGALATVATILIMMPNMTTLASFLVVMTLLYGVASWFVTGSSRISYVGVQMAIALSLALLNKVGPTVDLAPAGDRLFGIALGITVIGTVDLALWPVFSHIALRQKLADALSVTARFQRASSAMESDAARSLAISIYRTLSEALPFQDDLPLEPVTRESYVEQRRVLATTSALQRVFLDLLALHRHREAIQQANGASPMHQKMRALDDDIADFLDALAQNVRTAGKEVLTSSLSLDRLDDLVPTSTAPLALREAFFLYRELLGSLARLAIEVSGRVAASTW